MRSRLLRDDDKSATATTKAKATTEADPYGMTTRKAEAEARQKQEQGQKQGQRQRRWLVAAFGEGAEGFAGDAHDAPVRGELGAHLVVEVLGGEVPVEDVPLEAGAALDDGDGGNLGEERLADTALAEVGEDEKVLEVDAVMALPGGVVVEVEGEAGGLVLPLSEEDVEAGDGAEAVAVEIGGGGRGRRRAPPRRWRARG